MNLTKPETRPNGGHLPRRFARCTPSRPCPQSVDCCRAWARPNAGRQEVDASICLDRPGAWCAMFIDVRGARLLRAGRAS